MEKKRGRPKLSVSPKKEALILVAGELFRLHGFNRVSIDEICKKASVSKMSFYRFFKDKSELAVIIMNDYVLQSKKAAEVILAKKIPFSEKFKLTLELNDHTRTKMGVSFLEDLTQSTDIILVKGFEELVKKMKQYNLQFLESGQRAHFLNSQFKPEFLLFLSEHINLLFKSPELAAIYPDFSERVKMVTEFFYFGITKKSDKARLGK